MVDDATTLVARGYGVPSPRERISAVTTPSIVAYRLYEEGLQAYRREDPAVAYRLFMAALDEDSTFAMAAFYAGQTAPAGVNPYPLFVRAARLASHATDRERLWILEQVANNNYSPTIDAVAETLAVRYPEDPVRAHGARRRPPPSWRMGGGRGGVSSRDRVGLAQPRAAEGGWGRAAARPAAAVPRARVTSAYGRRWCTGIPCPKPCGSRPRPHGANRLPPGPGRRSPIALERLGHFGEAAEQLQAADSLHAEAIDLNLELAMLAIRGRARTPTADSDLRVLMRSGSRGDAGEGGWFLILSLRAQGRWQEALALARTRAEAPSLQEGATLFEMGRFREAAAFFRAWDARLTVNPDLPGIYAKQHVWMLTHIATCLAAAGDTTPLSAAGRLGRRRSGRAAPSDATPCSTTTCADCCGARGETRSARPPSSASPSGRGPTATRARTSSWRAPSSTSGARPRPFTRCRRRCAAISSPATCTSPAPSCMSSWRGRSRPWESETAP